MKKLIFLVLLLFSSLVSSQVLYKNKADNTNFKGNSGTLVFKQGALNVSVTPTCLDGVQNGDETGVDCGGSCPTSCPSGNPVASIVATDPTANESGLAIGFYTITLSQNATTDITVNYTVTGSATSGSDYVALSGSVVVSNGTNSATVNVTPIDDALDENTETIIATLTTGVGYDLGSPVSATVNLLDDDTVDNFVACTPLTTTPVSAVTLSQLTTMTNTRFVIDAVIDATNATIGNGNTLEAGNGFITGTEINVDNACIVNSFEQIFASTVTFSSPYDNSRLSPETFGALGNGSTADDAAIAGLMNNCEYAIGNSSAVYVKNDETVFTFSHDFNWLMQDAIIRTTNASQLSHGSATSNQHTYMFDFDGTGVITLTGGEFDGGDLASRGINFNYADGYHLEDMHIHNFLSPANAYARAVAIKLYIGDNFTGGSINNTIIENVHATSDGNANNSPYGVSKGISASIRTNNATVQNITNSTIRNISGDDAEGFYNAPAQGYFGTYDYTNQGAQINFDNMLFDACQRRGLKINASNVSLTNSIVRSATNAPIFSGAQATLVHVFSIKDPEPISNVIITGNTVEKVGLSENVIMGVTDAKDCLFENNILIGQSDLDLYSQMRFGIVGTQGGIYSGDLDNVIFRNNQMINTGFNIQTQYFVPTGQGLIVDNNTMTWNITSFAGGHTGAIQFYDLSNSASHNGFTISNLDISVNIQNSPSTLWAILKARQSNVTNMTFDNIDVTYTGTSPSYGFGHFISNFDSSNTVTNCTLTGVSGTGAITVDGATQNAVITNSTGDGNTPITFNN